jgi:hypothetical protein
LFYRNSSSNAKAFHYLISHQNSDGGWGDLKGGASTAALTAMALMSLRQGPEMPEKLAAVDKAVQYLLSGQHEDGGFGDPVSTARETALVYNALHGVPDAADVLDRAREFILSAQSANGSWNDDVYSTILAIEAFGLFGEAPEGPEHAAPHETRDTEPQDISLEAPPSEPAGAEPVSELEPERPAAVSNKAGETPAPAAAKGQVRERTRRTKISLVSRRKGSASAVPESSASHAGKDVTLQSVNTDRKKYISNETVHVYSTVDNGSDMSRDVMVHARIYDASSRVIDDAAHDAGPAMDLGAGACEPVTLSWNTGMNPPGAYGVRLSVADAADGRILDEKKITFSISPAIVIEGLKLSADPDYLNVNETATVAFMLAFQNRSNIDASLKSEIVMKDPEGNTVYQDSTKFDVPVTVSDAVRELKPAVYDFKRCGTYAIEAAVKSGNTVYARASGTVHVNPPVSIEAARSVDPDSVTPDGEKAVRVGILLKGVGLTANPSVVRARTNTEGDVIYVTCDKAMADPAGNASKLTVTADGSPVPVRDMCRDIPDITTFKLTLDGGLSQGQKISASYSPEGLACVEGKPLTPFHDEPVANKVSPPIFNQDGYGFSGSIPPGPLAAKTVMTGYTQWPTGFRKGHMAFTCAVFDGRSIWMVPENAHSVLKVDKDTGEMAAYGEWPEGFRKGNQAFTGAVFDGEFIWMVPANADSVVRVDAKNGRMSSYNNWPEGFSKGDHAFSGGVFDGTSVWMIPSYADRVVKIDTGTGRMTGYSKWPEGFSKGGHAFSGGVFDGRSIWMVPANADSVVTLDTMTGEMAQYNAWPEGYAMVEYAFSGGVFDGRSIWMVPHYSGQVIKIDSKTGEMSGHQRRPEELGKTEYTFSGAAFDGRSIWMVPLNADRVMRIDKDTSEATELHDWPQGFYKGVNAFAGGVFDGDCIWMVPSYADRVVRISSFSAMSVSANITSNDTFYLYVSQDESEEGTLVGKGQGWASIHSINAALVPGVTNYIHVKCIDNKGPVAAFIADFTLNDPDFHFTDGTQKITTCEDHWQVYVDKFNGEPGSVVSIGKNGLGSWSTRFGIDLEANWIWTQRGEKGTRYFSTPVYYSAVPARPIKDVHVTSPIGGPGVVLDEASFTRKPSRLERQGDTMTAEWHFESFRAGQTEEIYFNVAMMDPVPEEDRVVSDSLQISYTDPAGVKRWEELGPCHVHVLRSSFVSSIDLADTRFAVGDNVNIRCSFRNMGNSTKTARLTAMIEDVDGSVIKQASLKGIQFPPGEDKRIDNILLTLTSPIPGDHRARVILFDGDNILAEASADFVVVDADFGSRL